MSSSEKQKIYDYEDAMMTLAAEAQRKSNEYKANDPRYTSGSISKIATSQIEKGKAAVSSILTTRTTKEINKQIADYNNSQREKEISNARKIVNSWSSSDNDQYGDYLFKNLRDMNK